MKTLATLPVQAILTFEKADQAFYAVEVTIPAVPMDMEHKVNMEVDVLEQILTKAFADEDCGPKEELVKVSLCYCETGSYDTAQRSALAFLIRNGAKYYFQPNQRSYVEDELMQRISGLAFETRAFA